MRIENIGCRLSVVSCRLAMVMAASASSLRDYAVHRGCSKEAVRKAIRNGRLCQSVAVVDGRQTITDFARADAEWRDNTDTSRLPVDQQLKAHRHGRRLPTKPPPRFPTSAAPILGCGEWQIENACIAGEQPMEVSVFHDDEAVTFCVGPSEDETGERFYQVVMPPRLARLFATQLLEHADRLDARETDPAGVTRC